MKLNEYQRSRSFFDLGQSHSDFKVKCLTFGLYNQESDSGPQGPLVSYRTAFACIKVKLLKYAILFVNGLQVYRRTGNFKVLIFL